MSAAIQAIAVAYESWIKKLPRIIQRHYAQRNVRTLLALKHDFGRDLMRKYLEAKRS